MIYRVKDDDNNDVGAGDADDDVSRKSPRTNFEKGVLISSHPSLAYMHYNYAWLNFVLGNPSRTLRRFRPKRVVRATHNWYLCS